LSKSASDGSSGDASGREALARVGFAGSLGFFGLPGYLAIDRNMGCAAGQRKARRRHVGQAADARGMIRIQR
jgi:hypothetical protein